MYTVRRVFDARLACPLEFVFSQWCLHWISMAGLCFFLYHLLGQDCDQEMCRTGANLDRGTKRFGSLLASLQWRTWITIMSGE